MDLTRIDPRPLNRLAALTEFQSNLKAGRTTAVMVNGERIERSQNRNPVAHDPNRQSERQTSGQSGRRRRARRS